MRGDGTEGRGGDGAQGDADLDTLDTTDAYDDGYDEYGEYDDDGYDDDDPPARLVVVAEEDALYDDTDDTWYAGSAGALPPPDPSLLVIGDEATYEDGHPDDDADEPDALRYVAVAPLGRPGAEPAIWAPGTAPGAWVPLGRPHLDGPRRDLAALSPTRTRRRNLSVFSLAGITNVLLLAYAVTAALLAAFTAALARRRTALGDAVGEADRTTALARSAHLVSVTTWGVVALLAVTVVASMVWSGVAARNHRLLGGASDASPTLAVVGWIIPLANLVLPLRAVSEVAAGPDGRRSAPPSTLRWWIGWVLSMLSLGYVLWAVGSTSDADLPDAITRLTLLSVAATVCFLYCFSQASILFRQVARLQHDLALELD